jgi:ribonuclease BN (tRNA processing enzyme)
MTVEQRFSMGNRQSVEAARQQRQARTTTQIVMLGTGAPGPDPVRSGPATAIVVNGTPYLIDFGPGVVRRAAAAYQKGVVAFGAGVNNLQTVFLTHLHADHTAGYPDLILTPWIMGRKAPLEVYGPKGIKAMTKHVLKAWELDIANRVDGMERGASSGCRVNAHEIDAGPIYTDANIRVTAFPVNHGEMDNAFGFRFETADRTIVISGDTAPTAAIVENCNGCDVLIHEAYSQQTYGRVSRKWQAYRRKYHTSSKELAELAKQVNPGLLVLYHRANPGGGIAVPNPEDVLLDEIRQLYKGTVVTGHDLDVF